MKTPTASTSPTKNICLAAKLTGANALDRMQDRNDVEEVALCLDVGPPPRWFKVPGRRELGKSALHGAEMRSSKCSWIVDVPAARKPSSQRANPPVPGESILWQVLSPM